MKMNKLAAGALALALGLGAVAPAVAAETVTGKTFISEAYNEKIKEVEKLYAKKEADRLELEDAKKAVEAADALVKSTKKAYDDAAKASKDDTKLPATIKDAEDAVKKAKGELEEAAKKLNSLVDDHKELTDVEKGTQGDEIKDADALKTKIDAAQAEYNKKELAYGEAQDNYAKKVAEVKAGEKDTNLSPKAKAYRAYSEALDNQKKAIARKVKADRKYNGEVDKDGKFTEKVDGSREEYEEELDKLVAWAKGAGAILNIEGGKITVVPAETKKPEVKKDNLAELKRAREEALTAIKAVKLLKELSPEKIKNVEAKLNKLVAKNEELVKKADAKIAAAEKKMAFIATAYADEEADDTDALIKELDSTTSEIKELIKDKPEDKKPEEKKPEEKTPSKKAGNNARTGIAGVAGVAGILAAASVAYAASKRD